MATATKTHVKLTAKVIKHADEVIAWMSEHGEAKWRPALKKTEGGAPAITTVEEALVEADLKDAVSFVGYGTGALKKAMAGKGEDLQEAIVALKEGGRLMQFGRGRGYALILIDDRSLNAKVPAKVSAAAKKAPRAARTKAANAPEQLAAELTEAIAAMRTEYEERISTLDAKIQALSEKIQANKQTTWA